MGGVVDSLTILKRDDKSIKERGNFDFEIIYTNIFSAMCSASISLLVYQLCFSVHHYCPSTAILRKPFSFLLTMFSYQMDVVNGCFFRSIVSLRMENVVYGTRPPFKRVLCIWKHLYCLYRKHASLFYIWDIQRKHYQPSRWIINKLIMFLIPIYQTN